MIPVLHKHTPKDLESCINSDIYAVCSRHDAVK